MGGRQRPTGDCGRPRRQRRPERSTPALDRGHDGDELDEVRLVGVGARLEAAAARRGTGEAGRSREERVEARSRAWRCERHLEDVSGEGHAAVLALLRKNRLDEVELARRLRQQRERGEMRRQGSGDRRRKQADSAAWAAAER